MTELQVIAILMEQVRKAGSQADWARAHDITPPYLHDVLNFRRSPGGLILDALGLEKRITYHRKKPS